MHAWGTNIDSLQSAMRVLVRMVCVKTNQVQEHHAHL